MHTAPVSGSTPDSIDNPGGKSAALTALPSEKRALIGLFLSPNSSIK